MSAPNQPSGCTEFTCPRHGPDNRARARDQKALPLLVMTRADLAAWVALLDSGETPRLPRSAPADAPTPIYDELAAEQSRGQVA